MILIIFQIEFSYPAIALALTYSLLLSNSFNNCIIELSAIDQRMVNFERIVKYFDNPQENLAQV